MSKQSEAVKRWRKNCKQRIIDSLGGKCVCCGYNACQRALACHHLDPTKKDLNFGAIRANPKNWNSIVNELRKCVLLCHNCHCEVHDGIKNVPNNCDVFDESYLSYKDFKFSKYQILTPCEVCGSPKPEHQITCSIECAKKKVGKIKWDDSFILKELETKSKVQLAEELGVSDGAIHKRLKRIDKHGVNGKIRTFADSFVTNCLECDKEIKRFASTKEKKMFCSKKCHFDNQRLSEKEAVALIKDFKNGTNMTILENKYGKKRSTLYRMMREYK